MKTKTVALALLMIAAGLLAGCFHRGGDCSSRGSDNFRGQELRVLDHGAWDSAYAFAKPLFEERTGARLTQVKGEDAGGALRQAIDARNNPVADVIYGIDNALIGDAAEAGILEPYESPLTASIDTSVVRVDDFRRNGTLLATPVDHGYVSVNYDAHYHQEVSENNLPKDLNSLADPNWGSQLVVEDPRLSSPGLGFLVATVATFGDGTRYDYADYWGDLFEGGVLVAKDWTEAYVVHFNAGYGRGSEGFVGDRRLVVSYTTSPAAEAFYGNGEAPSVSLEPAAGVFHQVETAAILKCTKHLALARAFIDFLLGPEFQNGTAANMAVYPVVKDATVPEVFERLATPPEDLVPANFTSEQLAEHVPRWLETWTGLYQAHRA